MDFNAAVNLKSAISSSFLKTQAPVRRIISFSAAAAPRGTIVQDSIKTNVNGVGIGEKANGENYIKVLTRNKTDLRPGNLSQHFGVSAQDIVIQETGPIRFRMATNNHRPPFPGVSVGHFRITAGTLGCFVKDDKNKVYILSNNHVLANTNKGKLKDPILQPGKLDGGRRVKDIIAELSFLVDLNFSKPNAMDAALAELVPDLKPVFLVNKKNKISGSAEPKNKMAVEKFGRTTGHTKGKISVRNLDLSVDFDGKDIEFEDQFEIKGNNGKMFCDGGDSGSLIFESGSLRAIGLLFAGTDDGTTFATPIKDVLNTLSVKIL